MPRRGPLVKYVHYPAPPRSRSSTIGVLYSHAGVLRSGRLDEVVASVLEQTGRARRKPPPVLFLRTGGGWQLMGLLVAREEELRTCLTEAIDIDTQENVDAFVCVVAREDARLISEHLRLGTGEGAAHEDARVDGRSEVLFCAGSLAGERLSGVTGSGDRWEAQEGSDARAEHLCVHLAGLLL